MKKWGSVCCLVGLVILVSCASQKDMRDRKTIVASGYGADVESARKAARDNALEEMENQGLQGYEIVSESPIEVQKTDFQSATGEGASVTVTGYTAKTQFCVLGPEPESDEAMNEPAQNVPAP